MQCPFAFLGLETTATIKEIDKRYKQMMLRSHPDKSTTSDIISNQQAKLLNEAREKAKELKTEMIKQKAQQFWSNVDRSDAEKYALSVNEYMMDPSIQEILDMIDEREENTDRTQTISAPGARIVGYVYGGWNPLFGHLMKIGATRRQPYIRVNELSDFAGMPEPFQLVASLPTTNPFALENEIHKHFASVRKYGRKKEFFLVSRSEVIDLFQTLTERAMLLPPKSSFKMYKGKSPTPSSKQHKSNHTLPNQFTDPLKSFIQEHFEVSTHHSFVSNAQIKYAYVLYNGEIEEKKENTFFKELHRQIKSMEYPDFVQPGPKGPSRERGYYGLTLC